MMTIDEGVGHDVTTAGIIVLEDDDAVAHAMAAWLMQSALDKEDGPLVLALSGGTTPKRLLEVMAGPEYVARFPWRKCQFFYGDERHVPPDDPDSNYHMSCAALFSHVPVPPENLHPVPTGGSPEADAAAYEAELKKLYGAETFEPGRPLFDVVMLGIGPDGHTASLFPRQPVLEETRRWVSTCVPDDAPHVRITLTYPAIHSSRHVVFLLTGAEKAAMLKRVRQGDDASLPSSRVTTEGTMTFVIDRAAAEDLSDER
ncbi:6-phosphogluconolactonase [Acidomonas methanolica]|uniref:6-phosphogluconolactonase n=1 Tax=Acidomonas methanolica TaxID=437 RepID=UPI002119CDD0|nr:6-phosphogluconolactonase [Acidomonas methanolica]